MRAKILTIVALLFFALAGLPVMAADSLKVHGIFSNNMVLQRDKPIKVWCWAKPGARRGTSVADRTMSHGCYARCVLWPGSVLGSERSESTGCW